MKKLSRFFKNIGLILGISAFISAAFGDLAVGMRVAYVVFGLILCGSVAAIGLMKAGVSIPRWYWDRKKKYSFSESEFSSPRHAEQTTQEELASDERDSDEQSDFLLFCEPGEELDRFLLEHPLVEEFYTKVVGVTFDNDDGTSRQQILSSCKAGDPLVFIPYTYKGEPALTVTTQYGQIGNINANLAYSIEYSYDCDLILSGTIEQITGGKDGLNYGCNIRIKAYRA